MNPFRIALANVRFPATPRESVVLARQAIDQASRRGARIICFPECFIPGYRGMGKSLPPPDPEFLQRAWSDLARAAAKANITVIVGTERFVEGALVATALVIYGPVWAAKAALESHIRQIVLELAEKGGEIFKNL